MKFLVTGATGFIGKRLATRLLDEYGEMGNSFIFLGQKNLKNLSFLERYNTSSDVSVSECDVGDLAVLEKYFKDVDFVFHLAANLDYGNHDKNEIYRPNVQGTTNVLSLSKKYGIKRIVYLGTAGIYHPTYDNVIDEKSTATEGSKHKTTYTHSKHLAHLKVLEFMKTGTPIVNLLPVAVFGEGSPLFDPIIRQIKKTKIFLLPKSESRLSLVYVDDLADGIMMAFKNGEIGNSYIFSGEAKTLKAIAKKISQYLNRRTIILELPKWVFRLTLKFLGLLSLVRGKKFFFNTELLDFIDGGLVADDKKAKLELGFKDSDFEENFKKMVLYSGQRPPD